MKYKTSCHSISQSTATPFQTKWYKGIYILYLDIAFPTVTYIRYEKSQSAFL